MDYSEVNRDPRRMHNAEEMWAHSRNHLDKLLLAIGEALPGVYVQAGGNADASVTFDFMKTYIMQAEQEFGMAAHQTTILMAAAAITKLVRAPGTNDPLAQLDKEIDDHD